MENIHWIRLKLKILETQRRRAKKINPSAIYLNLRYVGPSFSTLILTIVCFEFRIMIIGIIASNERVLFKIISNDVKIILMRVLLKISQTKRLVFKQCVTFCLQSLVGPRIAL